MDRKPSPLAGAGAPWETAEQPSNQEVQPQQSASVARIGQQRSSGAVDEFALVGFNCKLPIATRRAVRRLAVEQDAHLQDIVNEALVRYLADCGVRVPRSRAEANEQGRAQG